MGKIAGYDMERYRKAQAYSNSIISEIADDRFRAIAYSHSCGVAELCALIAAKRGLDFELARTIGLLHDVYRWRTGTSRLHGINGAEMLRVAFKRELNGVFDERERTLILSAVYHHSDKEHVHDPYDEMLKDADAMNHYLYDPTSVEERAIALCRELGLPAPVAGPYIWEPEKPFSRMELAEIAEELAAKRIKGEPDDADFMRIIRYFPERSALSELTGAWCAAFVYHCCCEVGIALPIRAEHSALRLSNTRFACVAAWYEWAVAHGYAFREGEFEPQRGDIVIYDKIIPPERKPKGSMWCDHMGVVVSVEGNTLVVAEGNEGNLNVSAIVRRPRDAHIGCYIRIPDGYEDDGWKIDFDTGEEKLVLYKRES